MTKEEYFFHLIGEEAGEIAQMASKTARFGQREVKPGQEFNNEERLFVELFDLIAVFEMAIREGFLTDLFGGEAEQTAKAQKKAKVEKFMQLSRELGRLQ